MRLLKRHNNSCFIRLDPGEEFIKAVQDFCKKHKIYSAWLEALGSGRDLELAYYDLRKKKYVAKKFRESLEAVGILGNIALKDSQVFCHAHGAFGRKSMRLIGGHINYCVVSATMEVRIEKFGGENVRKFDGKTGLHLLH